MQQAYRSNCCIMLPDSGAEETITQSFHCNLEYSGVQTQLFLTEYCQLIALHCHKSYSTIYCHYAAGLYKDCKLQSSGVEWSTEKESHSLRKEAASQAPSLNLSALPFHLGWIIHRIKRKSKSSCCETKPDGTLFQYLFTMILQT